MSLRRVPPSWWIRMKSGWKAGVATSLALTGVAGTAISGLAATGLVLTAPELLGGLALCTVSGAAAAWVKGKLTFLPDSFVDELHTNEKYVCRFCNPDNLRDACDLT